METDKQSATNMLKRYMRYLKLERNHSDNTIEAYRHDLLMLLDFLKEHDLQPTAVKLEDLQQFAVTLHEKGVVAKSQARILCGVRAFYRFLLLDGYIDADPSELLESPKLPFHIPEYLTLEEVDQLEASFDMSKPESQRNRAIIEVLFSCGLRVSELVTLKPSDLYLEEKFVRVIGKGNKERLVPISDKAIHELELWFSDRCHLDIKKGEEDYVFLNRRGSHLTRVMILIMIKRQA